MNTPLSLHAVLATALIAAALACLPWRRLPVARRGLMGFGAAAGVVGFLDLYAAALSAEKLFEGGADTRLPVLAGVAVLAVGAGLFFLGWSAGRAGAPSTGRADRRIVGRVALILGLVAAAALLAAARMLEGQLETSFTRALHAAVDGRAQLYDVYLRSHSAALHAVAGDPSLAAAIRRGDRERVGALLRNGLVQGYTALSVEGPDLGSIAAGRTQSGAALRIPLKTAEQAILIWRDDGALIRSQATIADEQGAVATLTAERPLALLPDMLFATAGLGQSGIASICARRGEWLECLPTRASKTPVRLAARDAQGAPDPHARAIAGERGTMTVHDEAGRTGVVAYAPLGGLGLGLAIRFPSTEVFAPIRHHLAVLAPLLALVVAVGVILVRWQVTPLVVRLMRSERETALANEALRARTEALEFAERRLRAITDNVPALIGYVDGEGVYRFVNDRYGTVFQRAPGEIIGKPLHEVLDEASMARSAPHVAAALRGQRASFENRIAGRDFLVSFTPDLGPDDVVRGFYAMGIDITERKQAEEALVQGEKRLRLIADNVPVLIAYVDRRQRFVFGNHAYEAAYGVPADQLVGHTVADVLGPDVYRQSLPHIEAALNGAHERFERVVFRDGRARYELVDYIPNQEGPGKPAGVFSLVQDITVYRTMTSSLAAGERKLRTITDNVPALISYIDRERRFRFNNATYAEWLRRPVDEITGRLVEEVYPPEIYRVIEPLLARAYEGQRVEFEFEVPLTALPRTSGEGPRYVKGVYVPEIDAHGHVSGVYGLTYDVTEAKHVEQRLHMLAQFDALTGLPNRRHFNATLEEAVERHRAMGMRMAVMFLDIDHFKRINDTRGHAEGDEVLKEFARRVTEALRSDDTVARLAGDEFVIILEGLHHEREGRLIAAKILRALETPFDLGGGALRVTASIGIASLGGVELTGSELLRRADAALYKAKEAGRNCYRIAA